MTAAYKKQGLGDNAIKNLIAKNALESGWGKSAQGAFNFGNITTGSKWIGDYVDGKDKDADGNPITNRFRAYNSLDDYVKDEIQFLTSLYDFKGDDDFDTFIGKL
jgi:flagellum-specific peptidoglycan hydrolase FlgJ